MGEYDAGLFWERYRNLAQKDLPVIIKTDIKQSTLSTWRHRSNFPRADEAVKIADSLGTSVEYLVTGKEKDYSTCSAAALEIAVIADRLSDEGIRIALSVIKGLETQHPLENSGSIGTAAKK